MWCRGWIYVVRVRCGQRVGVYVAMFAQLDDSLVQICHSRSYWFGWEVWFVDGDVWSSVWEVLVSVCCMCGPSPEEAQVPFKVWIFVV